MNTLHDKPFADALCGHRSYLIRFASRHLRDAALVEDVVQETLMAALQAAARFEQRSSLRTWLTGILQRRIADAVRRARRGDCLAVNDADAGDDHDAVPDDDPGVRHQGEPVDWIDPQRRLEGRQFLGALAAGLETLPPRAARLFALRDIDGVSHEDAAAALGLSQRHAAILLHRARQRLRAALTAHLNPAARPQRVPA
jgi:RNA polymerase sigma-70 factor (ECF subfamily)